MSQQEKFTVEYKDPIGGAYYRVSLPHGGWIIQTKKKHANSYTEARAGSELAHLRYHLNRTFAPVDVYESVMNFAKKANM